MPHRTRLPEVAFYERAGFGVRVYKENEDDPGGGFAFVDFDGQSVFDLAVVPTDRPRTVRVVI